MSKLSEPPRSRACEEGLALFIVLIVVMVLTVLVTQLSISTKIEERVSYQHQGFLESTYSLQSVARRLASLLHEDWTADVEGALGGDAGGTEDPLGAAPGGAGQEEPQESTDPIETRHEEWRHPQEEPLNNWQIEYRIVDGESCFSLQHIFWYVTVEDDGQNPTESHKTLWEPAMRAPDPEDEEDDTEGGETSSEGAGEDAEGEEQAEIILEFQIPSEERIEKTKIMVSRLVEGVVDYNTTNDFTYYDTPNPDAAAEAICEWAVERMRDEETRRIRRLDPLKQLPDVGWELFNGPTDPAEEEAEEEEEEFGSGFGSSLDEFEDIGTIPGFIDVDGGVEATPKPLGLRHVLTPYSTGRINLNTCRPEVILALLVDIEDYEIAYEVSQAIDIRLNSYIVDEEADDSTTSTSSLETEEEGQEEFYTFTAVDDIKTIDEDDDELDWEEQVGTYDGDEMKIWDLILAGLRPISIYRSTYYTAYLTGTREDQEVRGELVVARDEEQVKVLSWREIVR